ncbi:MAG: NAD(P)H-dependent glycerol-3-phosphate dehydrogenase [Micavibrio sp.]
MTTIGIIGAGAWGTALAQIYAVAGKPVTLWSRNEDVIWSVDFHRQNDAYLPGITLHENIKMTGDIAQAAVADILLIVTPAQHLRATLQQIKGQVTKGKPVVLCCKGIEMASGKLLSVVADEEIPGAEIAMLTGPTFADEVGRGLPSAATIAARSKTAADSIAETLFSKTLRPYASDDLVSAEIGGAVKNVIAIASGIIHGKGLGESARAALVTRGLAEISRLAVAMGGRRETLMGMCGMGDLMLTCSSMQSRNFSLGALMGQGQSLSDILSERKSVTEGVHTARAVMVMAEKAGVDMPISAMVEKCVDGKISVDEGIRLILERPLKAEGQ